MDRIELEMKMEMEKMELEKEIKKQAKMEKDKITCGQIKNPNAWDAWDVRELIVKCKYTQTPETLEYYKSLNPDAWDVRVLIISCEYAQTSEMLEFFKSLNPSN